MTHELCGDKVAKGLDAVIADTCILDYRKAFDSADHNRLRYKMSSLGKKRKGQYPSRYLFQTI